MPNPITLTVWRRADTDPPEKQGAYTTDAEAAYLFFDGQYGWQFDEGDEPSWWCDPVPPGDDPLTTNDVAMAANACENESDQVQSLGSKRGREIWLHRAARLRRAIEEVGES